MISGHAVVLIDTGKTRRPERALPPPAPVYHFEELDQDSKLDNALHIEELDRAGQHRGARLPRIRHAIISFGLPYEPEDSQYGECR